MRIVLFFDLFKACKYFVDQCFLSLFQKVIDILEVFIKSTAVDTSIFCYCADCYFP